MPYGIFAKPISRKSLNLTFMNSLNSFACIGRKSKSSGPRLLSPGYSPTVYPACMSNPSDLRVLGKSGSSVISTKLCLGSRNRTQLPRTQPLEVSVRSRRLLSLPAPGDTSSVPPWGEDALLLGFAARPTPYRFRNGSDFCKCNRAQVNFQYPQGWQHGPRPVKQVRLTQMREQRTNIAHPKPTKT